MSLVQRIKDRDVFSFFRARYLGRVNEAFVPLGKEPALSVKPSFRDLQVNMLGRRKVLSHKRVKNIQAAKVKPIKKVKYILVSGNVIHVPLRVRLHYGTNDISQFDHSF